MSAMTNKEDTYEVVDEQKIPIGTYKSKDEAIRIATKAGEGCRVFMKIKSGTYESTTCVWPVTGATYSN